MAQPRTRGLSARELAEIDGRRLQLLPIRGDLLLDFFRSHNGEDHVECQGLPDDARAVGCYYDAHYDTWFVRVWSRDFDSVPDGGRIPEFHLLFSRRMCPELLRSQ